MPSVSSVKYAVRIIKPCLIGGEAAKVGSIHKLRPYDATNLIRLGRAVHAELDEAPKAQTRKPKVVKK